MMKSWLLFASPILLVACSAAEEEKVADPVATVRAAPATLGSTSETLTVYGTAEAGPGGERSLSVQAEAVLVGIVSPTGTAVRAGQVVATLRASATTRTDSAKAASDAAAADAALARAQRLRSDGLMSDADVETARAAAVAASAARSGVAQKLGTLTLRAPVAGTVQALTAKPGDVIAAGTIVATIASSGELRARFGVDPAIAQRVHTGQHIQLAAIGAAPVSAVVAGVDPQVDQTTRLAAIFARVPRAGNIGAGQALRGTIEVGASASGITIPYSALLDDGGRSYVFIIGGGVAHARDVVPGSTTGDRIEIQSGLKPGEQVVTEGGTALEDGMKVSVDHGATQ